MCGGKREIREISAASAQLEYKSKTALKKKRLLKKKNSDIAQGSTFGSLTPGCLHTCTLGN